MEMIFLDLGDAGEEKWTWRVLPGLFNVAASQGPHHLGWWGQGWIWVLISNYGRKTVVLGHKPGLGGLGLFVKTGIGMVRVELAGNMSLVCHVEILSI